MDVMGELFWLADGVTVGVVVGVPVASGLALGEDVKVEPFGLADGFSV
jgi:hypothetical protein